MINSRLARLHDFIDREMGRILENWASRLTVPAHSSEINVSELGPVINGLFFGIF